MCLILFAWKLLPNTPLVVAANRDEFYDRPTAKASWWSDLPCIFGGKDLKAGGTWLGFSQPDQDHPANRFAALTNVRAPSESKKDAPSRGCLVKDFLSQDMSAQDYVAQIRGDAEHYNGFNLLLCDGEELIWFSNRKQDDPRNGVPLPSGIYGISNAALDTRWHKVVRTKAEFASLICQRAPEEAFFEMLSCDLPAPDRLLPDTGVSFDMERLLSSVFISSPNYGTRSSYLVKIHTDRPAELHEKLIK
jgi:uncharacterized protein with NRDE domain